MIEWKNPIITTAQTGASPVIAIAIAPQTNEHAANIASSRFGATLFIVADPANRPIMNPSKCHLR